MRISACTSSGCAFSGNISLHAAARRSASSSSSSSRWISARLVYAKGVEATAGLTPTHNEAVGWLNERKQEGLQPFLFEAMEKGLDFFPTDFDSIGPNRLLVVVSDGFDNSDENASLTKDLVLANDRDVVLGLATNDATRTSGAMNATTRSASRAAMA